MDQSQLRIIIIIVVVLVFVASIMSYEIIRSNFKETETTPYFTGVRPIDEYSSPELQAAYQEFADKAKKLWGDTPFKAKSIENISLEIYSADGRGDLSKVLHYAIEEGKIKDPDFIQNQVISSLRPEINKHVATELQNRKDTPEIAKNLEVDRNVVNNWVAKYMVDKPAKLNDARYFNYTDDLQQSNANNTVYQKSKAGWDFIKAVVSKEDKFNLTSLDKQRSYKSHNYNNHRGITEESTKSSWEKPDRQKLKNDDDQKVSNKPIKIETPTFSPKNRPINNKPSGSSKNYPSRSYRDVNWGYPQSVTFSGEHLSPQNRGGLVHKKIKRKTKNSIYETRKQSFGHKNEINYFRPKPRKGGLIDSLLSSLREFLQVVLSAGRKTSNTITLTSNQIQNPIPPKNSETQLILPVKPNDGTQEDPFEVEKDIVERIIELRSEGRSPQDIASILGVNIRFVYFILNNMWDPRIKAGMKFKKESDTGKNNPVASNPNSKKSQSNGKNHKSIVSSRFEEYFNLGTLIPPLSDIKSIHPVPKIVRVSDYGRSSVVKSLRIDYNSFSKEYGVTNEVIDILDFHSQLLAKMAFYAKFNEIDTWNNKVVGTINLKEGIRYIQVMDILGKNSSNPNVFDVLRSWFNSAQIDIQSRQDMSGKEISSIDPSIQYLLDSDPRSFLKEIRPSSDDFELTQTIITETALAALSYTDYIQNGIQNEILTPNSPMLSRLAKDQYGQRFGSVTVPKMTRKGSDKLFQYKQHQDYLSPIFVNGEIETKHVGAELNPYMYRLRMAKLNQLQEVGSENDKLLMGLTDQTRTGDQLRNTGSRFLVPLRYHSYSGFGASSIDRIGRDLKNHYGITTVPYHLQSRVTDILWKKESDTPSKIMFIAGYNNIVDDASLKVGLDANDLIIRKPGLQEVTIIRIKQKLFGPGTYDGEIDNGLRETEAFQSARRIYDGFQARFDEARLYEAIYSHRSFRFHKLNRGLTWEEIPQGNEALRKWNVNLQEELSAYDDVRPDEILLFDGIESADDQSVRSDDEIRPFSLEIITGSLGALMGNKSLLDNPVAKIRIKPSHFWTPDAEGRLGLRTSTKYEVGYYTVEPEHFRDWLNELPADIYGKRGDGSTIERKKWYKAKKAELTAPDGEWSKLIAAREAFDKAFTKAKSCQSEYKALVEARINFFHAAPTEGPIREMQRALLTRLTRNPVGGLTSQFSTAFSVDREKLVWAPYTHSLEVLGYTWEQATHGLNKALNTIDRIQGYDEVIVSASGSKYAPQDSGDNKKGKQSYRIDVTGKALKAEAALNLAIRKFKTMKNTIEMKIGKSMIAFLDPLYNNGMKKAQLDAGRFFIQKTDTKYSRSFTKKDLEKVTSNVPDENGRIWDARWLGTLIVEDDTRNRILHGLDNFLKNIADPSKSININFGPLMYKQLRKYLMVSINGGEQRLITDPYYDEIWERVLDPYNNVRDEHIDYDGTRYKFQWMTMYGEFNGEGYKQSLDVLSGYYFKDNGNTIDFTKLRRTRDGGAVRINSKSIGLAWFLILNDIYDSMYAKAKVRANQTLGKLQEVNPLDPNWIKRNAETGKWEIGEKFKKLLDDTDSNNSWSSIKSAVNIAIADITNKDSTGWFNNTHRKIQSNTKANPSPWIQRILAGLPHDNTIGKPLVAKIRTEQQLNSVINEFLYVIDTIQNYVSPKIISPSWSYRAVPNFESKSNIDIAFTNCAGWYKILNEGEADYLVKVMTSLLHNGFNLDEDNYYSMAALISFIQNEN